MKRDFLTIFFVGIIILGGLVFFWKFGGVNSTKNFFVDKKIEQKTKINSFKECVKENNVIMESYPRQCRTLDGQTFTEDIGNELSRSDMITIDFPRPNDIIKSPLEIKGHARGLWFFEGSFPIKLVDDENNVLAHSFSKTENDWMTEEFIPFSAFLEFDDQKISSGKLILEKSNPSGMKEHDDALVVPVKFR